MSDKIPEEKVNLNSARSECELDEIDIENDPIEHNINAFVIKQLDNDVPKPEQNQVKQVDTSASTSTDDKKAGHPSNIVELGQQAKNAFSKEHCFDKVKFTSVDEGVPDETDVYNRFYFESDHLALKDNSE